MYSIAIDGPAAAGKTTTAKRLAKELNYMYVDTGAMYRGIAVFMLRNKKKMEDLPEVLNTIDMDIRYENGAQKVFLSNQDVTRNLRSQEVSKLASDISAVKEVRAFLLQKQRDVAKANNVVMEGRDIGSVILPGANVKFYLTADLLVRAQRRYVEEVTRSRGGPVDALKLAQDLAERDKNDSSREIAPLTRAPGSIPIDSTNLTPDEVAGMMMAVIKSRCAV